MAGSFSTVSILVVAAAALIVGFGGAFAAVMATRRRGSPAVDANLSQELLKLREERSGFERDLAVERERTSRATEARAALELELAGLHSKQAEANQRERAMADATRAAERAADAEISRLKIDLSTVRETLDQERRQSDEKLKTLMDAKETMTREFKVLANDLMTQHGESFTKQNKDQLDGLLNPFKETLTEYQRGLQSAHTDSAKERAALAEQIRQLGEQGAKMTSETVNLTRALKGESQTRGAWGEMVLSTILKKSGLRQGEEYFVQDSHAGEDGRRLRPDVIVHLPGGRHMIIDAKVSLVAYEAYANAETEEERKKHLKAHVASMRNHVRMLSAREYQTIEGDGLDYVFMFVPMEPAFSVALQEDPELTSDAFRYNVAITTPATLMSALRTIEHVWKVEQRNRNAEAIAERAGHLYNKFVGFLEDLGEVGARLGAAQGAHQHAMNKLSLGRGNLIGQCNS